MSDGKIFLEIDVEEVGIEQTAKKIERQFAELNKRLIDGGKITSKQFEHSIDAGMQSSLKAFAEYTRKLGSVIKNSDLQKQTTDLFKKMEKSLLQLNDSMSKMGTSNQDIKKLNNDFKNVSDTIKLIKKFGDIAYDDLIRNNKQYISSLSKTGMEIRNVGNSLLDLRKKSLSPITEGDFKGLTTGNLTKESFTKFYSNLDKQMNLIHKTVDKSGNIIEITMKDAMSKAFGSNIINQVKTDIAKLTIAGDFIGLENKIKEFNNKAKSLKFIDKKNISEFKEKMNMIKEGMTSDIPETAQAYKKLFETITSDLQELSKKDITPLDINNMIKKIDKETSILKQQKKLQQEEIGKVETQVKRSNLEKQYNLSQQYADREVKQHKTLWEKLRTMRQGTLFRSFVDVKTFATSIVYLFQRVGRAIGYTIEQFKILESGVNLASTLIDNATLKTIGGLERLRDIAKDISYQFGTDMATTTSAMYKALTSGVDPENLKEIMTIGNQLAVGGRASFDVVLDGLTSIINAYDELSYTTEDTLRVSDAMFTAMKFGKFTLEDLSGNLGQITTSASLMGVEMEEVVGVLATLTRTGLSAEEASTQIRNTLKTILDPAQSAKDILDELGITYGKTALEGRDLSQYLTEMKSALREAGYGFQDVFGNIRGLQGVLALTGNLADDYNMIMEEMELNTLAVGTATQSSYSKMSDSTEMWEKRSKAAWDNAMSSIGESIQPIKTAWDKFIFETLGTAEQKLERITTIVSNQISVANTLRSTFGSKGQFISDYEVENADVFESKLRNLYAIAPDLAKEFSLIGENIRNGTLSMDHLQFKVEHLLKTMKKATDEEIQEGFRNLGGVIFDNLVSDQDVFKNLITDEELKGFDKFIEKLREVESEAKRNGENIKDAVDDFISAFVEGTANFDFKIRDDVISGLSKSGADWSSLSGIESALSIQASLESAASQNERDLDIYMSNLKTQIVTKLQEMGVASEEDVKDALSHMNKAISGSLINSGYKLSFTGIKELFNQITNLQSEITSEAVLLTRGFAEKQIDFTIQSYVAMGKDIESISAEIHNNMEDIGTGFINKGEDLEMWREIGEERLSIYKTSIAEKEVRERINESVLKGRDIYEKISALENENLNVLESKNENQMEYLESWNNQYNIMKIMLGLEEKSVKNQKESIKLVGKKLDELDKLNVKIKRGSINDSQILSELQNIFDGLGEITSDMVGSNASKFVDSITKDLENKLDDLRKVNLRPELLDFKVIGDDLDDSKIIQINTAFERLLELQGLLKLDLSKNPLDYEVITDGYGNLLDNLTTATKETMVENILLFEDFQLKMQELSTTGVDFRMTDETVDGLLKVRSIIEDIKQISPEIAEGLMNAFGDDEFFVKMFLDMQNHMEGIGMMGESLVSDLKAQYNKVAQEIKNNDTYTLEEKIYLTKEAYDTMMMQAVQAERDAARKILEISEKIAIKKTEFQEVILNNMNSEGIIQQNIGDLISDQSFTIKNKNDIILETIERLRSESMEVIKNLEIYKAQLLAKKGDFLESDTRLAKVGDVVESQMGNLDNITKSIKNKTIGEGSNTRALLDELKEENRNAIESALNASTVDVLSYADDLFNVLGDVMENDQEWFKQYPEISEFIISIRRKLGEYITNLESNMEALEKAKEDSVGNKEEIDRLEGEIQSAESTISNMKSIIGTLDISSITPEEFEGVFKVTETQKIGDTSGGSSGKGGSEKRYYELDFIYDDKIMRNKLEDLYKQMYDYWKDINRKREKTFLDLMIDPEGMFDKYKSTLQEAFGGILDETDGFISSWEKRLIEAGMVIDDRRKDWESKLKDLYMTNAGIISDTLSSIDSKKKELSNLLSTEGLGGYTKGSLDDAVKKLDDFKISLENLANVEDISLADMEKISKDFAKYFATPDEGKYSVSGDLGYSLSDDFLSFIKEIGENLSIQDLLDKEKEVIFEQLRLEFEEENKKKLESLKSDTKGLFEELPSSVTDFYANHYEGTSDWLSRVEKLSLDATLNIEAYAKDIENYIENITDLTKVYSTMLSGFIVDMNMNSENYGRIHNSTLDEILRGTEEFSDETLLILKEMGYNLSDVIGFDGATEQFRNFTYKNSETFKNYKNNIQQMEKEYQDEYLLLVEEYGKELMDTEDSVKAIVEALDEKYKVKRLNREMEYRRELLDINKSFQKSFMNKSIAYYESLDNLSDYQSQILDNFKENIKKMNLAEEFNPLFEQVAVLIEDTKLNIANLLSDIEIEENKNLLQDFLNFDYGAYRKAVRDRDREQHLKATASGGVELSDDEKKFLSERDSVDKELEDQILSTYENIKESLSGIEFKTLDELKEMFGDDFTEESRISLLLLFNQLEDLMAQESDLTSLFKEASEGSDEMSSSIKSLNRELIDMFDLIQKVERTKFEYFVSRGQRSEMDLAKFKARESKEALDFHSGQYTSLFDKDDKGNVLDKEFEYKVPGTTLDKDGNLVMEIKTVILPADVKQFMGSSDERIESVWDKIQELEQVIISAEAEGNELLTDQAKTMIQSLLTVLELEQELYDNRRAAYHLLMSEISDDYDKEKGDMTGVFGNLKDFEKIDEQIKYTKMLIEGSKDGADPYEYYQRVLEKMEEEETAFITEKGEREARLGTEDEDVFDKIRLKDIEKNLETIKEQRKMYEDLMAQIEGGEFIATEEDLENLEEARKKLEEIDNMLKSQMVESFIGSINQAISGDGDVDWGKLGSNLVAQGRGLLETLGPQGKMASAIIGSVMAAFDIISKLTTSTVERDALRDQELHLKMTNDLMESRNKLAEMYKMLNLSINNSLKERNHQLAKNIEYLAKLTGKDVDLSKGMEGIDKNKIMSDYTNLLKQRDKAINDIYNLEKDLADDNLFDNIGNWFAGVFGNTKEDRLAELEARKKFLDNELKKHEELIKLVHQLLEAERKRIEQYAGYYSSYYKFIGDQKMELLSQIDVYDQLLQSADYYGFSQEQTLDYMLKQSAALENYLKLIEDRFKKEQDLVIKRAKIAGYTEEQIRDLRRQAVDDQIALLESQLVETEGYDKRLDLQHRIADLMLERLNIEKEINGEISDRNVLYDEELRGYLRNVIEARKINDDVAEEEGLMMSAQRMLDLGVTPDEIYRLLGVDIAGLTPPSSPAPDPFGGVVGDLPDVNDALLEQEETMLSLDSIMTSVKGVLDNELSISTDSLSVLIQIRDTISDLQSGSYSASAARGSVDFTGGGDSNIEVVRSINRLNDSISNLNPDNINNNINIKVMGNQKVETYADTQRNKVYHNRLYNK